MLVPFRFNEELIEIEDTSRKEKDDQVKRVVTGIDSYLCRKFIIACSLIIREDTPVGKADSLARVQELDGTVHTATEITHAEFADERSRLELTDQLSLAVDAAIVQVRFLSARETFERLNLRLNDDGSIAIDPYFETSRHRIFASGDVHGDIKLITVTWAEGIQATIYAFKEITSPYWPNEKRLRDHKITHAATLTLVREIPNAVF